MPDTFPPTQLLMWAAFIQQAVVLGVKSYDVIRAVMHDAGADDAMIAALAPQWDQLRDDVARAAGVQKADAPPSNG